MHGIQDSSEQVSAGSNQLAVSAQDIAEGATHQAASVEELVATVDEVTSQVLENPSLPTLYMTRRKGRYRGSQQPEEDG